MESNYTSSGFVEIIIEEGSSRNGKSFIRAQIDGSIGKSFIRPRIDGSIRALKKNGQVSSHEKTMMQKGSEKKEEKPIRFSTTINQKTGKNEQGVQEFKAFNGTDALGKGVRRIITITGSEREGEIIKKKEYNNHMKTRPARGLGLLNINERFDTYIQRKKEDMSGDISFDPAK